MHLLNKLIETALNLESTDIHLCLTMSNFSIFYRKGRLTQLKDHFEKKEGQHLIDYLLYKSQVTLKNSKKFYHLSYSHPQSHLRIAYHHDKNPHVTIRVHKATSRTSLKQRSSCLEKLIPFLKNRFFLQLLGPINSGKTTLYYEILSYFHEKLFTILSVEEPIEKEQDFWQLSFHQHEQWIEIAEQSIRFDLDIIGFGEIRKDQYWSYLKKIYESGHNILATAHRQWSNIKLVTNQQSINHLVIICENYQYTLYQGDKNIYGTDKPLVHL
jgi:type II secretory ATPase GspE/PulE/Tfp pilus assembly ATPase PilB-like protein